MAILSSLLSLMSRPALRRQWRVTGPYLGTTGYDRLVRSLIPRLRARGIAIEVHEQKNWSPTRTKEKIPKNFTGTGTVSKPEVHLHICMPSQVICTPGCRNVNYTMFEASRIPQPWVKAAQEHDLIIVPTESSRESWIESGVPAEKLRLCPQGSDFAIFSPQARPLDLFTNDGRPAGSFRSRFLNVAETIARKNLSGLLRVWLKTTTPQDDAVLMLKPGFYHPESRRFFTEELLRLETELGKKFQEAAPIIICDRQLSEAEMPRLYTAATHYWSMSHGEGFDLPMMEAAACDLQSIAPWHSSYRHYLSERIAFLLPAQEIDVSIPGDPALAALFYGSKWWQPDEEAAANIIQKIIKGTAPPRDSSRKNLQPFYNWDVMAERLIQEIR